jgi:hypothetical protein
MDDSVHGLIHHPADGQDFYCTTGRMKRLAQEAVRCNRSEVVVTAIMHCPPLPPSETMPRINDFV